MKKLILGAMMMIGFVTFSTAQKKVDSTKKTVVTKVAVNKTAATSVVPAKPAVTAVTPAVKTPTAVIAPKGTVLKKDGTPDKRYTAAPKGPLKKDGTLDKRYKENKKP